MATSSSDPYVVISSDSHAGAPIDGYKPYLAKEFHDEFEAWKTTFSDAWSDLDTEMPDTEDEFLRVGVASFMSPYNWNSDARLAHMDQDGIAAELIFPNTVPPFYPSSMITAPAPIVADDVYRLRWAGVQAHNRWLVDFCAEAPGRRRGLAQVFLADLDDAIAEVRWAKEAGLAGILMPSDHHLGLIPLYEPRLDAFWAVCAELDIPVHRHTVSVSPSESEETGPAAPAIGVHECQTFLRRGLAHLILGGVFERFPTLKFVMTETNCAWAPAELFSLDTECKMAHKPGNGVYPYFNKIVQDMSLLPSEYFARNCWFGASQMNAADVRMRHVIGVDKMMWGSDYPHHEGSWPHSRVAMRLNFSDVPEPEVRQMTSLTAAEMYGFDLDYLQTVADKIGPTVEEMATPVSRDELPDVAVSLTLHEAIEPVERPAWAAAAAH
jgi:predicted TIM-barrel fold metal-dependent hydrolase